jgi:hypothetical protein
MHGSIERTCGEGLSQVSLAQAKDLAIHTLKVYDARLQRYHTLDLRVPTALPSMLPAHLVGIGLITEFDSNPFDAVRKVVENFRSQWVKDFAAAYERRAMKLGADSESISDPGNTLASSSHEEAPVSMLARDSSGMSVESPGTGSLEDLSSILQRLITLERNGGQGCNLSRPPPIAMLFRDVVRDPSPPVPMPEELQSAYSLLQKTDREFQAIATGTSNPPGELQDTIIRLALNRLQVYLRILESHEKRNVVGNFVLHEDLKARIKCIKEIIYRGQRREAYWCDCPDQEVKHRVFHSTTSHVFRLSLEYRDMLVRSLADLEELLNFVFHGITPVSA